MGQEKQKAIVIKEFKQIPVFGEVDIAEPKAGQVKVKVIASTINPSDRIRANGDYWRVDPPFVGGFEGVGEIIKVGCPKDEGLIGKRVSFATQVGSWCEYTITDAASCW